MGTTRRALLTAGGAVVAGAAGLFGRRVWLDREPTALPAVDKSGRLLWQNWSGTEHAYPANRVAPASADEAAHLLRTAAGPVRTVGAGHSFTGLVPTDTTLVSLDRMSGLSGHDPATHQASIAAGTRLYDLGPALAAIGQDMPNLPDINKQSLAGATQTGTHGTGAGFKAVHGGIIAFDLATPRGEVLECSATSNPEVFAAARVGLGAFGIITRFTMQNHPLTRVKKVTSVRHRDALMDGWDELATRHRNVEFYVIPFSHQGLLITHDATTEPVRPRGPDADTDGLMKLKSARDLLEFASPLRFRMLDSVLAETPDQIAVDEGWKLLSNERPVRFREMEYHLPRENQIAALREVVEAIERHRSDVFIPIEVRSIAADDAWLSTFYGRESGSIAVHAYYKDDYAFFYALIEPILRRHGGRPHWGKLNSLKHDDFAGLYPRWKDALAVREHLDPEGKMLNPYLAKVFRRG
ncbi:D-arabinono-1,4-lactone oxidase [Novosphingobium sp. FKTRR1]|uniref:D-arabinono-1,4-lactone oxidase n=1 Tax=Novosphingobium sp. FKTRR1 TaxID=2879118 RepID=UPI001CEFED88|nr:D-arabinono-1,4-lactone oxidase [Novosphingobium sp. FKTRR1]